MYVGAIVRRRRAPGPCGIVRALTATHATVDWPMAGGWHRRRHRRTALQVLVPDPRTGQWVPRDP